MPSVLFGRRLRPFEDQMCMKLLSISLILAVGCSSEFSLWGKCDSQPQNFVQSPAFWEYRTAWCFSFRVQKREVLTTYLGVLCLEHLLGSWRSFFDMFCSVGGFKLSSFAVEHVHPPPPFLLKECCDSEMSAGLWRQRGEKCSTEHSLTTLK